jgi:hypothetical protein
MPTRIVREGIISSERVNLLSERAELFYRKLMNVADDYGRFYANPISILGACYPLRNSVKESDVVGFISECVSAKLLVIYGNGRYIQVLNFRQQTRSKSKFPEPLDSELLIKCEANSKHLSRVVVGVGVGEDAGVGLSNFQILVKRLGVMFNRKEGQPMSYAEESSLAEIARRPDFLSELEELKKFRNQPDSYFPQSLYKLASGWGEALDRARSQSGILNGGSKKAVHHLRDSTYDARTPEEIADQEAMGIR